MAMSQQEAATVQTTPAKSRNLALEFNAGYSMVLGDYGKSDSNYSKSGYATGGWLMQFTFDWMGKGALGISLQYTFQHNALQASAEHVIPDGPFKYPLGTGSWSNHFLMVGPVFMKNFNRIHFDAKLLFGGVISSSSVFNMTDPVTGENVKDVGMGLAFQASAGIGYTFSKHFALKFNIGYLAGWPSKTKTYGQQLLGYEEVIDPDTGIVIGYVPIYSAPAEYAIKKVISTLNPSLGAVFRF
jgi:hypothetical protein